MPRSRNPNILRLNPIFFILFVSFPFSNYLMKMIFKRYYRIFLLDSIIYIYYLLIFFIMFSFRFRFPILCNIVVGCGLLLEYSIRGRTVRISWATTAVRPCSPLLHHDGTRTAVSVTGLINHGPSAALCATSGPTPGRQSCLHPHVRIILHPYSYQSSYGSYISNLFLAIIRITQFLCNLPS